ncbi:MAG TPA: PIG-L deacetylase family protein [Chloroflexia bacterium]|nr:PIG-L deacetylase family protein [Chloroflexia bacterium]
MSVLVIAPHPDDEAIGCGGIIALRVESGERVCVAFLTSGELGLKHLPHDEAWRTREGEAEAAARVLGLAQLYFLRQPDWLLGDNIPEASAALRPVLETERPREIYVPHTGDWHPDHKASLPILLAALRVPGEAASGPPSLTPHSSLLATQTPLLRTYEVWTPLSEYAHVEDISAVIARKLAAVRCYKSQLQGFRYDRAARGLAQYRGALAGRCRYAEVFGNSEF